MAFNKVTEIPAGADVSRTPPIMEFRTLRRILKGFSFVTLSRSEGSIALGHEMLSRSEA